MNVVVCIKQVPGTTEVNVDPVTGRLKRENVKAVLNPLDAYALEEGLRLRDRLGGKVTALTMGPPQAAEMLKDALSLGVDEGVLLCDAAFAGSDTLATSMALSKAVSKIGSFDLVICGRQTIDGDTGQVGPELAERLGLPFVSYVSKIEMAPGVRSVRLKRMVEEGYETLDCPLPAVVTVAKEINTPRLPSLRGMMKAKTAKIPVWTAADIGAREDEVGLAGSATQVVRVFRTERTRSAEMLPGTIEEQVEALLVKLRDLRAL